MMPIINEAYQKQNETNHFQLRFSYQRQSTSYFVGDIGDALLSKMKS
jgi:hypothetical protein